MTSKPIYSLKNVSIGYKEGKNINLICPITDFEIFPSQVIGIVGANGSGKSTLLRTMAGLIPPIRGSIFIDDISIPELKKNELAKRLSMVFTNPPLIKTLSVFELVALGRQPYTDWLGRLTDTDIKAVEKALDHLQLLELANIPCWKLSDGQLQKALIAKALAQDTAVILLDEPTTYLDFFHKVLIFKQIKKIAQETFKSLVISTHEIDLAIELCDYILLIGNGKTYFDTPLKLIQEERFLELFDNSLVSFDRKKNRFTF